MAILRSCIALSTSEANSAVETPAFLHPQCLLLQMFKCPKESSFSCSKYCNFDKLIHEASLPNAYEAKQPLFPLDSSVSGLWKAVFWSHVSAAERLLYLVDCIVKALWKGLVRGSNHVDLQQQGVVLLCYHLAGIKGPAKPWKSDVR